MGRCISFAFLGLAAALAVGLALLLPMKFGETLPQVAGEDVLSVVFSDARDVVGRAFLVKADSYFHGGMSMECEEDPLASEGGTKPEKLTARPSLGTYDPWAWINAQVEVRVHRHIEGKKAEEIIPWVWAACRTSPHNIQAYTMGWYVLSKMSKMPQEGLDVLVEGIKNNPDNIELEFTRGQSLFSDFHDKAGAAAAFQVAREKAIRKAKGDLSTLSDEDATLISRTLFYLGVFARDRGDIATLRQCLAESEAAAPDYVCTHQLRDMLAKAAQKP